MRQETFAILFLMRKGRPKKNGLAPIFARITTGGLRQEVYTQCDSNPETWNQHKERAMGTNKLAIQVNERLNDFRVKIIDIRTKLLAEGYAANAAQIKQRYLNPTCNTMMLIAGLADYAKRRQGEVGVRITQRTADKYERLLRYLKQYLAQRGKAEDIPVERMNYEFLDGFNLFLQTAHRCRHNGAVAVMDCLRNFVLYCLRNEWITKNPFRYYKLKEDEVQAKEHLTAHELELLTRKELDHRLARIRDVFVFCCLTGLAFADADHLRREHLSQDDEGRWWIHKPREKTSVMSRIPLLPASLEILRRYERDEACLARGRVREKWKVGVKGGYIHTWMAYDYKRDKGNGEMASMTRSRSKINTFYGSADGDYAPSEKWLFTAGVSVHQHLVESADKNIISQEGNKAVVGYDKGRVEFSGSVSAKWRPVDRFAASLVLREDMFGTEWAPVIPAFFIDGVLSKKAISWRKHPSPGTTVFPR